MCNGRSASKGAIGDRESGGIATPRRFRSRSNSLQDCGLSRTPSMGPMSSILPSGVAPMMTSKHCAASSSLPDLFSRKVEGAYFNCVEIEEKVVLS